MMPMSNVLWHMCKIYQMEKVCSKHAIDVQSSVLIRFFRSIERGKFLALDLGGTNFRVLIIHLKGENEFQMQSKIYAIPQNIMLGSGTQLFDHIAECLSNFMKVNSSLTFTHNCIDPNHFCFVLCGDSDRNTVCTTNDYRWASHSRSHWNNSV